MMKKSSIALCLAVLIGFLMPQRTFAADVTATQALTLTVNGSVLLAVTGGSVGLSLSGATQAGEAAGAAAADSTTRLKITSVVNQGETRGISGQLSANLTGTRLYVTLINPLDFGPYPETQGGGTSVAKVLLSTTAASLVSGITTCWSGIGTDNGYMIKYNYERILNAPVLKSAAITVTYTISAVSSDV